MKMPPQDVERFWSMVDTKSTCWVFGNRKDKRSYGHFSTTFDQGTKLTFGAHRIAYWLAHGVLDGSNDIDHLCHNPACVRPSHLEMVDRSTNLQRGHGWRGIPRPGICCANGHSEKKYRVRYEQVLNGKMQQFTRCIKCHQMTADKQRLKKKLQSHGTIYGDPRRAWKLFCGKGHRRTLASVIIEKNGQIRCKECRNLQQRTRQLQVRREKGIGPKKREHCSNGHMFDEQNTIQYASGRKCRKCIEAINDARRLSLRANAKASGRRQRPSLWKENRKPKAATQEEPQRTHR